MPIKPLPQELQQRFRTAERSSFLCMWQILPSHMHDVDFALDGPGWSASVIDNLSKTLLEYYDIFSTFPLDYGECSTCPFETNVSADTPPIHSHPYRTNPALTKHLDAILSPYLSAGLIQHSTPPWASPFVCVPKKSGGNRNTVNYQKLISVTEIPKITIARVDEVFDSLGGGSVWSVFDLFSFFFSTNRFPG